MDTVWIYKADTNTKEAEEIFKKSQKGNKDWHKKRWMLRFDNVTSQQWVELRETLSDST